VPRRSRGSDFDGKRRAKRQLLDFSGISETMLQSSLDKI
jgi:hypothetical protein